MVKLTVLYPTPADPRAFDAYYFGTHVPIADTIPGLLRNEVSKVTGTLDGGPIDYYLQAELYFESTDAAMAALAAPRVRRLRPTWRTSPPTGRAWCSPTWSKRVEREDHAVRGRGDPGRSCDGSSGENTTAC